MNAFHNMNMKTKLVFTGDWDIHIDMSLCLCYKRLAWFGLLIYMNSVLSWCLKIPLNLRLRYALTIGLSKIENLDLTWCIMIWSELCWYSEIGLLLPSTKVEVLIVVIQHEHGTCMTHLWCMHLYLVIEMTCIMIM